VSPGRQPSSRTLRRRLVEELETTGALTQPAVRAAFLAVPRERFLPATEAAHGLAAVYVNKAVVTRTGQGGAPTSSSSQPAIMAPMLERLELRRGHRVLEIGAGTGYNAALLSTLVGHTGHVVSVELEPDVAAEARTALAAGGHPVEVVVGDGRLGWEAGAPYDRIMATASTAVVPHQWVDQLAPDGLIEVPVHLAGRDLQAVVTFRRQGDGLRSTAVLNGGFMVLRGAEPVADTDRISVTEWIGGRHRSLGALSGDRLGSLRPVARDRLARLMLEPPIGRTGLGPFAGPGSPGLFLRLARPKGAVMLAYTRTALPAPTRQPVAAVTVDGRSLAVLSTSAGGKMQLESYGDPRAAAVVLARLDDWQACGRPDHGDLVVDVTFDATGRSTITTGWRRPGPA
jgi:protein-L-isoaspartate(D-aspartate) O-methyltransferase